jgi:hypothetical protein
MVFRHGLFWYVAGIIGMDGYTGRTGRIQVLETGNTGTWRAMKRIGMPEVFRWFKETMCWRSGIV